MKKNRQKKLFIGITVFCFCLGLWIAPQAMAKRDYLVVQTWGGAIDIAQRNAFFDPFEEETGIKVLSVEAGTSVGGKLAAMQRSGNIEWDIITADYESYNTKYYNKGLLEEIDYSIVNNTQDLLEGSVKKWGVAQYLEGMCLVYNTKVFPEGKQPSSYKDFFDVEKFPGPRSMHNWGGPTDNLSIALMSEGVNPDDVLPTDFDRAFKIMDKIKPHIKVWYTSGAQLVQALLDEEVVMAISTDGRAKQAINSGAPIKIVWNQSFYYLAYNCVVKGTPLKDEALRLIACLQVPNECDHLHSRPPGYAVYPSQGPAASLRELLCRHRSVLRGHLAQLGGRRFARRWRSPARVADRVLGVSR